MRQLFADTGYWVGVAYEDDELHDVALATIDSLSDFLITSEMVLTEFLNYSSKLGRRSRELVTDTFHEIENYPNMEVVPQTSG